MRPDASPFDGNGRERILSPPSAASFMSDLRK
jgi:hypothetical protein